MALLLDVAMETHGSDAWNFNELPDGPQACTKKLADIDDPITIQQFIGGSLRHAHELKASRVLVDITHNVPEFGRMEQIFTTIKSKSYVTLPDGVRPASALPDNTKLSVIIQNNEDGTFSIIKVYMTESSIPMKEFVKVSTGVPYAPIFRKGPWAVKKAFQTLLDRVPGYHVDWCSVTPKPQIQRQGSAAWNVPDEALDAGVKYVNTCCPEDNDESQMWLWVQKNIKEESGSPVAGWPENKVRQVAENKAKANHAAAAVNRFFPLCFADLHMVWHVLLPLIVPLLPEYGLLLLGVPEIGKTPAFIIIAMAMSRYWVRTRPDKATGHAGWRRGKTMDAFSKRTGRLEESVFLDDPNLMEIPLEELKHFFDVGEDRTVRARYHDAKFVRNAMCGSAQNEFDEKDEPPEDERTTVDVEEGLKLMKKPFEGALKTHVMAVLKRNVTIVIGKRAVYIRFPSSKDSQVTHRIAVDKFHEDWLLGTNKEFYGLYKKGIHRTYAGFEENVAKEQEMVYLAMSARGSKMPEDWIAHCDETLQKFLKDELDKRRPVRILPASPGDTPSDVVRVRPDADGHYRFAVPHVLPLPGSDRRRRFRIPGSTPDRRVRMRSKNSPKTNTAPSDHVCEEAAPSSHADEGATPSDRVREEEEE